MKKYLVGVDECGRGPLVGSVVACAVMVDETEYQQWQDFTQLPESLVSMNDSKKLSEKKRDILDAALRLYPHIHFAIGEATAHEIDQINILQASLLAMRRAVHNLPHKPSVAYIDGNKDPKLGTDCDTHLCVKGDSTFPLISAASIIAKVYRDKQMFEYDKVYPQYLFAQHKGYPTKQHLALIKEHGITDQYRKTFGPVKLYLNND